mgnify:CR=1 FL=1
MRNTTWLKEIKEETAFVIMEGISMYLRTEELRGLLAELDEVEVKGRQKVDTLLGCMMALEAIIGKENNDA